MKKEIEKIISDIKRKINILVAIGESDAVIAEIQKAISTCKNDENIKLYKSLIQYAKTLVKNY